jgi:hypothetical protein
MLQAEVFECHYPFWKDRLIKLLGQETVMESDFEILETLSITVGFLNKCIKMFALGRVLVGSKNQEFRVVFDTGKRPNYSL